MNDKKINKMAIGITIILVVIAFLKLKYNL